ncbi:MAG: FAD-dependent oxidoreductase [bacterium]|nr:FAD-dependent oxidoreductase [bacterium]
MSHPEPSHADNRATLNEQCRPSGYRNPDPQSRYNLVVVGSGTAGISTALGAALLGAKVALVERDMLGGSRLHSVTLPTKALVRAGRAAHALRTAEKFGVTLQPIEWNSAGVLDYVRAVQAKSAASGSLQELLDRNVDVFFGTGRFVDAQTLDVEGARLRFARAVVATGVRPAKLGIPGLAECEPLYSNTLLRQARLPDSVAILGGGPVGVELAQALTRLGVSVLLYEQRLRILPREDADVSTLLTGILRSEGVQIHQDVRSMRCVRNGNQRTIECDANGLHAVHTVEQILVTVGNTPNIEELRLDQAGVEHDPEGIRVTEQMRTTNPRIFACGDVASEHHYPHASEALARTVVGNALFFSNASVRDLNIPTAIYTDPEIARVGISAPDGIDSGLNEAHCFLSANDRARLDHSEAGFVKLVHDRRGQIKGATIVSPRASELIGEVVLAMNHRISLRDLALTVHPYPTESELLRKCGDYYRTTLLTPAALRLVKKIMDWRR